VHHSAYPLSPTRRSSDLKLMRPTASSDQTSFFWSRSLAQAAATFHRLVTLFSIGPKLPSLSFIFRRWRLPSNCSARNGLLSRVRSEEHMSELQSHLNLVC